MKLLIHMGHPAHVHLFKNLIEELKRRGNEVVITVVDKEITTYLLDTYGFSYHLVGKHKKGILNKIINIMKINKQIYNISKDFQPEIMLGVAGLNISQVGKLLDIPSIILDDTEHSTFEILLYKFFATHILTPSCFTKDLGQKQIRYNGYHELAYLHPNFFTKDSSILDFLGVEKDEKYIIMRFVSWNAFHDRGYGGLSLEVKRKAVKELSKHAKIFVSSESPLPRALEKYRIQIPPEKIHDALYYATLHVGEGATMVSECAVLGTPAIYVNSLTAGTLEEQEKRYGLLVQCNDENKVVDIAINMLKNNNLKKEWIVKRKRLLSSKIDTTKYLCDFIDDFIKINEVMIE